MREIKFRGMEVFDKKWVYGWLANIAATSDKRNNDGWRIIENISDGNVYTPVIPDTVGEFVGLTDINSKEIYEGDVVESKIYTDQEHPIIIIDYISFRGGCFIFDKRLQLLRLRMPWVEVIGNIYENPEMVKE